MISHQCWITFHEKIKRQHVIFSSLTLCKVIMKPSNKKSFGTNINKELIKFIHKLNNPKHIISYRPITLLNT
jgi:hypothetical protein